MMAKARAMTRLLMNRNRFEGMPEFCGEAR